MVRENINFAAVFSFLQCTQSLKHWIMVDLIEFCDHCSEILGFSKEAFGSERIAMTSMGDNEDLTIVLESFIKLSV